MKTLLPLLASLPFGAAADDEPVAPPIEAQAWLNHIGQAPSLESLRGRPVLIERWATW